MPAHLTCAQQRALREAEDTPHGPRLRADVRPPTAASLVQAHLCSPPMLPPGRLIGDTAVAELTAHWLTVEGIAVRAALRRTSEGSVPPEEAEEGCMGQDAQGWLLSWQEARGGSRRARVCGLHLPRALTVCAGRARLRRVQVEPVED